MDNGFKPNAIGSTVPLFGGNAFSVFGPGASTDNAVARWDGITGTLLQDTPTWTYDGVSQTLNGGTIALNHTDDSVAIGEGAGNVGTATAVETTAVGSGALASIVDGISNTAVGYNAANALDDGSYNTCFGHQSGLALEGGDHNTLIGFNSGASIINGTSNTLIGRSAGFAFANSVHNTGVGRRALRQATGNYLIGIGYETLAACTSDGAVAIGYQAGNALVANSNCVFVGYQAGLLCTGADNTLMGASVATALTSGARNVCVGSEAGAGIQTESDNVCVGHQAGSDANIGTGNTFVGRNAGDDAETTNAVGIGHLALNAAATQQGTVGVGAYSFNSLTSGQYCVAVGYQALNAITTADSSTAVGYQALMNDTGGSNCAFGDRTGDLITTGTNNILIGVGVDPPANNTDDYLAIGHTIFGNLADEKVRIGDASGGGIVNKDAHLEVDSDNDDDEAIFSLGGIGTNGATTYFYVGDRNPNGAVTAPSGSVYIRVALGNSGVYSNTSAASPGNTWTAL